MPKFVSNSSGTYYASNKSKHDEDEILAALKEQDGSSDTKKPSAVNKKGTKEKQKSSLDLFKEELRRLNEEQEDQRNKVKNSLSTQSSGTSSIQQKPQAPIPVPLLPDPRCPTSLTLQVNLNPKDKDAPSSGSFDTGDPTTTNLYIGNLNPTVTENELCDIFGRFGPLASIKIMWPRTDEERARNRNSGFVAYMSRIDGERALKVLNGMEYKGYDMKLGWGKAVPLPKNPVFIPADLLRSLQPPPRSGLPFNAQLHPEDVKKGYQVPQPLPRPLPTELTSAIKSDPALAESDRIYREFLQVFERSTVRVCIPQDRSLLHRIHKTIEFVIREGPVFESIITAREAGNPDYNFLTAHESPEHIYYRWKLYSILHGDDPHIWNTEEFRMFAGGPIWQPPPLNPFADGMSLELVEKLTGVNKEALTGDSNTSLHRLINLSDNCEIAHSKAKLNATNSKILDEILSGMEPTKTGIGSAMLFCINHSYAADEIINRIKSSISAVKAKAKHLLSHLFLISDILNNSSAAVTNASYYREGFRLVLEDIFVDLREHFDKLNDTQQVSKLNQKICNIFGAWKYYQLYEDEFVLKLSNLLVATNESSNKSEGGKGASILDQYESNTDLNLESCEDLDGEPIDDATLAECLELKGLSLRWYKTLELSDDEADEDTQSPEDASKAADLSSKDMREAQKALAKERFKVSKWEIVSEEPEHSQSLMSGSTVSNNEKPSSSEAASSNEKPD